jgi:hypothetical protein
VSLAVLFALLVILPPLAGYTFLRHRALAGKPVTADQIETFTNAVEFRGRPAFVRVVAAEDLNPLPGKDFLIGLWIKPHSLPASPQTVPVLSRYSPEVLSKPGYSLSLSRDGDSMRVTVYWRASSGRGQVFVFSDIPLVPHAWTLLALSFHDQRYLGLHTVSKLPDGTSIVRLAGGYRVGERVSPDSSADLLAGSYRGYQGAIGGLFVIQSKDLTQHLNRTLKNIGRSPRVFPENLSDNTIRFWSDDFVKDRSKYEHRLSRETAAGEVREQQ